MAATTLKDAIREAIKQNELGNGSPYKLSFAQLGQSGASFGLFQGDTNVSPVAQKAMQAILVTEGIDASAITRIMNLLCKPCPNGNPLNPIDRGLVEAAMNTSAGRAAVDKMDAGLFDTVLRELDSSANAARAANLLIEPVAQLYIALWVNMTGAPSALNLWIGGVPPRADVPCPSAPTVTEDNILSYLKSCLYFEQHPRALQHMSESVALAKSLLPAAAQDRPVTA